MQYMPKVPLALRIDEELLARVDEACGDVPRTRWIERALESALRPVGSPRAPEPPVLDATSPAPGVGKATRPMVPAVQTAQELMAERQRRLNAKR